MTDVFEQPGYGVRLEWGADGVAALAPHCCVVVVVDVLSFSTAVDVAVGRGAAVLPLRWDDGDVVPAGAVLAGHRGGGSWSLSPSSLLDLPAGTRLALPSPNGATLSAAAAGAMSPDTAILAGCLRNASALAAAAIAAAGANGVIGLIPAGERWPGSGRLRPAVEDLVGAGAVAAALAEQGTVACSPEAIVAADAFRAARERGLATVLAGCSSARELAAAGYAADVELAARYDVSRVAPVLRGGEYRG